MRYIYIQTILFVWIFSGSLWPQDMVEKFGEGEGIRFKISNVQLNNQTDEITLSKGGPVDVILEVWHDCPECGGALNQVIVGLAGQNKAQACIWDGMNFSSGIAAICATDQGEVYGGCSANQKPVVWEKKSFVLNIPDKNGTYYIRARYAQAYGCHKGALAWWQVDRPNGPDIHSTIGIITVDKK